MRLTPGRLSYGCRREKEKKGEKYQVLQSSVIFTAVGRGCYVIDPGSELRLYRMERRQKGEEYQVLQSAVTFTLCLAPVARSMRIPCSGLALSMSCTLPMSTPPLPGTPRPVR